MPHSFETYEPLGDASFAAVRRAAGWDLGLVTVVFMVFWPMPALRITLALPWSVHGPLLVIGLCATWWLYALVCAVRLRRTVGMYLADLGFAGDGQRPRARQAAAWALGWAAALLPAVLGVRAAGDPVRGWAARWSGMTLASIRGD